MSDVPGCQLATHSHGSMCCGDWDVLSTSESGDTSMTADTWITTESTLQPDLLRWFTVSLKSQECQAGTGVYHTWSKFRIRMLLAIKHITHSRELGVIQ